MTILAKEKEDIQRSSQNFFSGTLLSRVLGLVRDVLMAYFFGAQASIAALMVAFRLSSLLRRLFGEGALHAAFVPAYEKIRLHSEEEGAHFFSDLSLMLGGGLFAIILITEGALFYFIQRGGLSVHNREILILMTALFPSLVFICHAAFCSSFLQCQGVYFLPAISPVFFNLFWIMGALFGGLFLNERAVYLLALFITLGLFMQWLSLFPKTLHYLRGYLSEGYHLNLKDMARRSSILGKPLLLGLIGVSTTQLNNALDTLFARFVDLKGPAYLWYALRIEQVPLAIFGIALAGAVLPMFSRAIHKSNQDFHELIDYSLARSLGLLIPCSVALMVMGPSVVNLLYGRGLFDPHAAVQTTHCLWGYALGLTTQGLSLILASAFYAKNQYRITTLITVYSLVLNVVLNILFAWVYKWGSFGIALATSITSLMQCLVLFIRLRSGEIGLALPKARMAFIRVTAVSLASGLMLYLLFQRDQNILSMPRGFFLQAQHFSKEVILFTGALFVIAWLFRVKEIFALLSFIPKLKKK